MRRFNLNTYKEEPLDSLENWRDFLSAEFVQVQDSSTGVTTCGCKNIVLEAHYRVMFTDTDPDDGELKNNQFFIDRVDVDLVYGNIGELECEDSNRAFTIKTSITYLQESLGRRLSGAPGYLSDQPLMIGVPV